MCTLGRVSHERKDRAPYQMIEDLVPDNPHHFETLLARDRVDNHVPVNSNKVLVVENCVFVLASSVDDLHGKVLVPIPDDFAEGVLDGGVVGVDKVAIDILDRQRALACKLMMMSTCCWR